MGPTCLPSSDGFIQFIGECDGLSEPVWGKVHFLVFGPLRCLLVSSAVWCLKSILRHTLSMAWTLWLSWPLIALLFLSGLQCEQGKRSHSRSKRDLSDAQ